MQTIDYTSAQQQLQTLIHQVSEAHEPLCIKSPTDDGKAVLMAESDYHGLMETLYLLSNPVNAEKLMQAAKRSPEQAVAWENAKADLGL